MKINEKIDEMQSKLIKAVIEANLHTKEQALQSLEEFGLDGESATKLLVAYRNAESAKETAKNVWNTALQSRTGVDSSTDIAEIQQSEIDTRTEFENINATCALQMVLNQIKLGEINDEVLNELYEQGIKEQDIDNPTLRITFHYYSESKAKDIQREKDLEKVKDYSSRIRNKMTSLENQLREAIAENKSLRASNASLKSSYENLKKQFKVRTATDEKHYQVALSQISSLKQQLRKVQDRGIFQTIGAKLTALFGKKTKELPEVSEEIPNTLYKASSEKMGLHVPGENDMPITKAKKGVATQTTSVNRNSSSGEWQQ